MIFAQRNVADSAIGVTWLSPQYGFNISGGDLAERYGYFNAIGFTAGYKTKKTGSMVLMGITCSVTMFV